MSARKNILAALASVALVLVVALAPAAGSGRPEVRLAQATNPLSISNSKEGQAVLSAGAMKPGDSVTGSVTLTNDGQADGDLYLAGNARGELADTLRLSVRGGDDAYDGGVAPAACRPLGRIARGESRTFDFTVSFPRGANDNELAGKSASVDYTWTETEVGKACGSSTAGQTVEGETEDVDDDEGGGSGGRRGTSESGGGSPPAGGSSGADSTLPFTGLPLLPVLVLALSFVFAGARLRRRLRD